ncbi:nicotinamidase-related amidase [Acetoanaerobium pronyense]|uniref:Nicotinamidase-related amidase n=1 Tax=Acetoanaerobium pronyense TaxID=1482736 RepID=A0ABS4KFD7_9FIRM|nr:hypothetical protein [Acetoanaerobium pronyense]MBP2026492.1 nicotinamidase-related amidase [Acetoanaerobium pronyense]
MLVVIDMQNDFVDPEKGIMYVERAEKSKHGGKVNEFIGKSNY